VAWSVGPVRPFSEGALRRRAAIRRGAAAREAAYEERWQAAAAEVRQSTEPVRRWGAGWPDWLTAVAVVVWGRHLFWGETGLWRYGTAAAFGVIGVTALPGTVAWRITADSRGLWFNGLRRPRHIAWGHIRVVRCKGAELKVDSHRASFDECTAFGPRWPWLERKLRLIHPYERTAAEITAM
jgi:hypothetical protein